MEKNEITLFCVNDGKNHKIEKGKSLKDLADKCCKCVTDKKTGQKSDVLAALVDNKLKELSFKPVNLHQVEFIGYNHPDGRRSYVRSLCFVLQNAVRELYPDKVLVIDHSLPSGLYCEIREIGKTEDGRSKVYFVTDDEIDRIREKMKEIVARNLPFTKVKMFSEEAEKLFIENNQPQKAELQKSLGTFICSVYYLDRMADTFHGPLIPSTGYLKVFDISGMGNGFCLQSPMMTDFCKVMPMKRQGKIAAALKEYSDWCSIINIGSIGTLNKAVKDGKAVSIINLAESLHERNYARIADRIYAERGVKRIVMIAGPSSSGKTSSSLRIALQCKVLGLKPKVIELDNYFVDREHTPKDEDGNYDFEAVEAIDVKLFNEQLLALMRGEEVEIPKYNFKKGEREYDGTMLKLDSKSVIVIEGTHGLTPALTPMIPEANKFRIYVAPLAGINFDQLTRIHTTDNRLIRRIVRDYYNRGHNAEATIAMWPSVRRGEDKFIYTNQEEADVMFNSCTLYELAVLKVKAEPLLLEVKRVSPHYAEAKRLLRFLGYFQPLGADTIPPTSLLREFVGGSSFVYD